MDLKKKYQSISDKFSKIDFNQIWNGFHQYNFALYDSQYVCYKGSIFPKTNEFIANTSIHYDGEMIGIWHLMSDVEDDILTSKLIHETFHAYQTENNESRFPNEIKALINYKYDPLNLSLKMEENRIISALLVSFSQDLFDKFIAIRQKRSMLFPDEVIYEMAIEQIEGTANYVELEALKQLNFDKYTSKLNQMVKSITTSSSLIPIRIISYDIGALIIKVLRDNQLTLNDNFNDDFYLDYLLKYPSTHELQTEVLPEIHELIHHYYQGISKQLETSINEKNLVVKGDFELLGVNVYNAKYMNKSIITEYFLMYKENEKEVILNGNFVVKLNDKNHICEVYKLA